MTLKTKLTVGVNAMLTSALDLAAPSSPLDYAKQFVLADGAGASQANRIWHDKRTLAASATEDLDLSGTLKDALGSDFILARVKGLLIKAADANVNNVVVGAAASNAWATLLNATGTLTLRPGELFFFASPHATAAAVTAGTGDLLKVANSGAGSSVDYDIVIVGAAT